MSANPLSTTYSRPLASAADMARAHALAAQFFVRAADLPLTFTYGGQTYHGLPAAWQPTQRTRRVDATMHETVWEAADPATGLAVRVEVTAYADYPVLEWVAYFTNVGSAATPLLSDVRALDAAFSGSAAVLHHSNGDFYNATGYTQQATPLGAGATLAFAPHGGRPCDQAFPYYRLVFAEGGLTLAIGWPAQWAATFSGTGEGVQITAGQEQVHASLQPGERLRTPRMTLLAWAGDDRRAVNLWRRWYLAHILPRPDGRPMRPHLACAATDEGEEFTAATEANQIAYIDRFQQAGIHPDVWWIDAGWYPCRNAEGERRWILTGTWEPDAERFPRGLGPISDHAAANGADLLVWFEPERVDVTRRLAAEHPEWLLHTANDSDWTATNALLNLGLPECRQWLTDHLCALIQNNRIKIYRQDFNFEPLRRWRDNEAEDRQGLNENFHVQGYLQLWDDLLARNPGLWIDSCSSGGRRNDLETMRRSVPLHYTDYGYGDHPVKLGFHQTLFEWIPYFKEFSLSWDVAGNSRFDPAVDSYSFHCGFAPMLFATLDIRRSDYDFATAQRMIAIWRRAADLLLYGDYYALTPAGRSPALWVARQFDSPETGAGLVQGIRLPAAPETELTVTVRGLDPTATYDFEEAETGAAHTLTGAQAAAGFTLTAAQRGGTLWFYRRRPDAPGDLR